MEASLLSSLTSLGSVVDGIEGGSVVAFTTDGTVGSSFPSSLEQAEAAIAKVTAASTAPLAQGLTQSRTSTTAHGATAIAVPLHVCVT